MQPNPKTWWRLGGAIVLAILAACGMSDGREASNSTGAAGTLGAAGTTGAANPGIPGGAAPTGAAGVGGVVPPPLPPEQEVESSYEVPISTGHFVWIANPSSGRVAYVDAAALTVRTVEAGNGPTYMAVVPGADDAVIVLNTLSKDATLLRVSGGALQSRTFAGVAAGSNAWAVSPDGHYAIAWTDARRVPNAPKTRGFQEVTIIDLQARAGAAGTTTLAVGYRPASFAFAGDSKRAFAVTEDGVSVIALAAPAVTSTVALGANGATDAADTRDVSITPDGRLAVVRRDDSADVGVVDLDSRARTVVTLNGSVTDVDVAADGARAVAVVRDAGEVSILPLAGSAPAPSAVTTLKIPGETIGQVTLTAGGKAAVLYSNAVAAERITVLALGATPAFHVVKLHAAVLSALPTPDGKFAVVLHPADAPVGAAAADAGVPAAPPFARAFSLLPLEGTQPPRIEMTDAPVRAVAVSPASDSVLVTVRGDQAPQVFGAYLGLLPSLQVKRYPLASPPIAAGVVGGANRGYVAQQHPEGRITFLSLDSGDARTLTGYELGARVVEWSR